MIGKGYIQLYTGNGKGKTTAALGLAMRAAGAGLRTVIIQFMKGQHYSELDAFAKEGGLISIEQYGSPDFCRPDGESFREHKALARRGYERAREVLEKEPCDIVILDESVTALGFKLLTLEDLLAIMRLRPEGKELVLTGRGAPDELIQACDLVTEMREIRHYYNAGVPARKGIEN